MFLQSALLYSCVQGESDARDLDTLQIIALGDWGKGGFAGDILSVNAESLSVTKGVGIRKRESGGYPWQLRGYKAQESFDEGEERDSDEDEHAKGGGEEDHNREEEHDREGHEGGRHRQEYTYQVAVAGGISSYITSSTLNTTCILALGDNFYDDGVSSANDTMWTTHWKKVYLQNYTNLRIPWYPIFGNHDYGYGDSGAAAQLDRAKEIVASEDISAGLWHFDSYNYSKCMDIPGSTASICFIFIDTTTLAPSSERNCNEEGGISTDTQAARIADQLFHVERMLIAAGNSTWVVVCGHYPIYTSGEHGDNSELISYLQPLIEKYNVSIYLAGHDHLSGHLRHEGIEYFIAGGGAMVDPLGDEASAATDVWYGVGYAAFSVMQVTRTTLEMKFVHWNGTEMYNYTLNNPRRLSSTGTDPPSSEPSRRAHRHSQPLFVLPNVDVSPSLVYIAAAAGSLTGLILSLTVFSFGKRAVSKHISEHGKRRKKYASLPATYTLSGEMRSSKSTTDLPDCALPKSPSEDIPAGDITDFSFPSSKPLQDQDNVLPQIPKLVRRATQLPLGVSLVRRLSMRENYSNVRLQSDHRKTKSDTGGH